MSNQGYMTYGPYAGWENDGCSPYPSCGYGPQYPCNQEPYPCSQSIGPTGPAGPQGIPGPRGYQGRREFRGFPAPSARQARRGYRALSAPQVLPV